MNALSFVKCIVLKAFWRLLYSWNDSNQVRNGWLKSKYILHICKKFGRKICDFKAIVTIIIPSLRNKDFSIFWLANILCLLECLPHSKSLYTVVLYLEPSFWTKSLNLENIDKNKKFRTHFRWILAKFWLWFLSISHLCKQQHWWQSNDELSRWKYFNLICGFCI